MIIMSSVASPDFLMSQNLEETSIMNINSNTIVIENSSDDITISKCDQPSSTHETSTNINTNTNVVPPKVLPLVYIKNNGKIPFATVNAGSKTNNNNFIISPISSNPSFVTGRGRSLVLPKQPITIMPAGAKVTGAYVTMIKQVPKPTNERQITDNLSLGKGADGILVTPKGLPLQKVNQPQKIVLAPMPKIHTNRLPATATTNSLQTKFTVLPMAVPQKDTGTTSGQKVYNFQISDGKVKYTNFSGPLTLMCEKKQTESPNENQKDMIDPEKKKLECDEKIDNISLDKNDISDKTYELSIAEESLSNQSDNRLVVSSVDSNSSSENAPSSVSKPQKHSHGISILKKNILSGIFQETKMNDNGTVNTIQKSSSESDITIIETSSAVEEKVVAIPSINIPKPEREKSRRKSQFCFRKDFDESDISFLEPEIIVINKAEEKKEEVKEEVEEKKAVPDIKPEIKIENMEVVQESETTITDPKNILNLKKTDDDALKLLTWDENIGTLPGSNLKFTLNEFGIIEYLSEEDYLRIMDKKQKKAKEKEDMEREVHCIECGCYGIRSDFINSDYCSIDCQDAEYNLLKKGFESSGNNRKGRKRFGRHKSDNDIKDQNDGVSGDEDNSNDTSHDKFAYPWACKKKGFSWSKYLAHVNAKAAPVKLFKDPFPYNRNGFKPGMKLEGVDPQHPSYFCVLTVVDTVAYRIRLHFDGYPDNYDFWTYADSMDIFPAGWCEKYCHTLHPPPGYTEETFNWSQYLRVTKSTAAPKHLFANRAGQAICPNGFRIGMKLEAVDKKNSSLICVATVRDMMDNRILVHFDGWDDIYDYWVDPTSPYIHPVGWCDQYGHNLTPPSDYPTPENFTWEKFLKESKSVAAPVRAFKQRPACGFKRGMRLECVDRRVTHLIRVATVDDVKEHQIRIHFDGWPDRYCYWVDDDSPDIHPVGWCQKTGHPLEPPLTPDDIYDFLECPTVGCRGQGHIRGLKYSTHSTQKFCPYADANIDLEKVLPDRLLSPDRTPEARVPVSREPKDYRTRPRIGRPPKWLKELEATQLNEEPPEKKMKKKNIKRKSKGDGNLKDIKLNPALVEKAHKLIEESKTIPAEKESWKMHSAFLRDFIISGENPNVWSPEEVREFVTSIPGCDTHVDVLRDHHIDGESFLHLSQKDILRILKFKVGPAVKLYNTIVLLREQYSKMVSNSVK